MNLITVIQMDLSAVTPENVDQFTDDFEPKLRALFQSEIVISYWWERGLFDIQSNGKVEDSEIKAAEEFAPKYLFEPEKIPKRLTLEDRVAALESKI